MSCDDCLRRTDLIAALAGWLDIEWRKREAPARVLALSDERLLDASGSKAIRRRYDAFDPGAATPPSIRGPRARRSSTPG